MRPSLLWLVLVLLVPAPSTAESSHDRSNLQALADELIARLSLDARVEVAIVAANPTLVSVEPATPSGERRVFTMSFQADVLELLDEEDLRAVVAHELGHVWIFTHHPYLQTERLANDIARRVVSRESLEKVYAKVWAHAGAKGDVSRFLGQ